MGMAMGQAGGAVMGGQSGHPGMVVGPPPGQGMAAPVCTRLASPSFFHSTHSLC